MTMTTGTVFQINVSQGGVPKLPIQQSEVTTLGLGQDKQKHTKFHGGPERAVCLYSLDLIQALQAEGHPIYPGAIGENLTIAGIAWADATIGSTFTFDRGVVLEVTSYAVPCNQISFAFQDKKSKRVHQDLFPGWARLYCKVVSPGQVSIAEPVQFKA